MLVKNLHTVHVEITNKCNAKCPGCERHNTPNGEVHPELLMNPTEYSVDDFKNYFSNETIYKKEFYFGGTVDEPLMNKNVVDISEHILSNGGRVTIETNTGANTVETFTRLGKLSKQYDNKLHMLFSVDGMENTNHLYRVNVKWPKVIENMKAYSSTEGSCTWQYLVFDHNYDDIEEAKKLAKELDIELILRQNVRNTKPWISISKSKNKETKKIETKTFKVKSTDKFTHPELKNEKDRIKLQVLQEDKKVDIFKETKNIHCRMVHSGEVFIAWDKRVWPCCWFASDSFARYKYFDKLDQEFGKDWNSLANHSLQQVLDHKYYATILEQSWNNPEFKDYYYPFCYRKCGDKASTDDYFRKKVN